MENEFPKFLNIFVVGPSQKKTISDTPKMENGFFIQ